MFNSAQIKQVSKIISNNVARKRDTVYFDKLKTGARSIKVWHWDAAQYNNIIADLQAAGYTVKLVLLAYRLNLYKNCTNPARLHVSV